MFVECGGAATAEVPVALLILVLRLKACIDMAYIVPDAYETIARVLTDLIQQFIIQRLRLCFDLRKLQRYGSTDKEIVLAAGPFEIWR